MAYKHGVYIREQETSLIPPIEGTAGLQVIFGTAPINLADEPYKAVNKPIICNSFAEAVNAVGYSDDFKKYTLCQSIDACFRVFNVAPIVLVNVLDPKNPKHIREVEYEPCTLTKGRVTLKESEYEYSTAEGQTYLDKTEYCRKTDDGSYVMLVVGIDYTVGGELDTDIYVRTAVSSVNSSGILKDTVVVKSDNLTKAYTEDVDYILSFDADGYVTLTVLDEKSIGASDTIRVSFTRLNPDGVTHADIIGGVDFETGAVKGLECIGKVFPMFGYTPGLILAPGWSDNDNVIAAMEAKCSNINGCFSAECIVDISTNSDKAALAIPKGATKYADTKVAKESLGIDSPHTFVCWPLCKIGEKVYTMSALLGALLAYTDAANDDVPYIYPSNKSFGITGICLEDGTDVLIDQEQANIVNSYGIVTAINMNGYKCWGNNTAAYPGTTDPKDRWIAIRRMFTWWGNTLILTYFQKVDDPANYRLIESIIDSENIRGNSFIARGICAAANVEFLPDENPITDILNGKIVFHVHLSPYTPAEDIEFVLEFDPQAIQKALEGGN